LVTDLAARPAGRANAREPLLWGALAVALSPALLDLLQHWTGEPWARPFLLVAALGLLAAWRDERHTPPRPLGYLLVAAGVALVLIAAGGGMTRLGRPGLPLAIVGMALVVGRPVLPIALLSCWAVPPPKALLAALPPGLETALGWAAIGVTRAFEGTASFGKEGLVLDGATLRLDAPDGGVPLALMLAGLGWWSRARLGGTVRDSLRAALRLAPWGLAAQALVLCLAFAMLAAGAAGGARALLDHAAWAVLAFALLAGAKQVARSAGSPSFRSALGTRQ